MKTGQSSTGYYGLFDAILKELSEEADFQDMSIDSSTVKAYQSSAGAKKGL